jgi:transcription termination factor NusB
VGILEKAILLNATSELVLFKNKKEIVISESNKLIKKFITEDKTSNFITGILNEIKM